MTAAEMKKYAAIAKKRRLLRRALMMGGVLCALFFMMERNVKPLVFSLAEARSAAMASQVLYGALAEARGAAFGQYDENEPSGGQGRRSCAEAAGQYDQ